MKNKEFIQYTQDGMDGDPGRMKLFKMKYQKNKKEKKKNIIGLFIGCKSDGNIIRHVFSKQILLASTI